MSDADRRLDFDARLAVHGEQIERLEEEQQRHRERLHLLESDRAALKLIAHRVDDLADHSKTTAATVQKVAEDVTTLLLDRAHDEGSEAERERLLESRRFMLTTIVVLVAGLVSAVATLVWLALG